MYLTELLGEVPTHEQFAQQRKAYDRDVIPRLLQDVAQDPAVAWKHFVEISTPSSVPKQENLPSSVGTFSLGEEAPPPLSMQLPAEDASAEKREGPFSWFNRMLGRN